MDIQKEREAFEKYIQTVAHPHRLPKVMFFTVNDGHGNVIYCDISIQNQWETWQAAKAQAVPEGFVVVPKQLTEATKQKMMRVFRESDKYLNCNNMYSAMIEAQEQKG